MPVLRPTLLAATLLLAGCAADRVHREAMGELLDGKSEAALVKLRRASEMDPGNPRFRIDYLSQRALYTQALNARADDARNGGRLDEAAGGYADALRVDPTNERALRGLQLIQAQRKADLVLAQAERAIKAKQPETARELLRQGSKDMPQNASIARALRDLDEKFEAERAARDRQLAAQAVFKRPVTLQFRDANLKMVFEALSRTANVNIILDREVKNDLKTTIYVKDASVEDTIDLILLQNQLEKRVLNNNTLFVYPATAPKQKEYNELKVRSFQLSNVEAAYIGNLLKTLLKAKDVVTDAKTNTLVMRDTPEAIAVAEKIVAANDLPDPEVMLEVEVLEVSSDRLSNLGIAWPDSIGVSTPKGATTIGDLKALTRNDLLVTPLSLGLNLMLKDSDTNILASPRIRTRNKEKAKVLVGDKVPVISNLLTPQQAGQTSVITGSIQYVDVGIKLEVEPQVYADGDVGIKVNLEVSSIGNTIKTDSGVAYQIGTRSAQTSLRLRDGETQVLAGLISDKDLNAAAKVPGIGQAPVLGRLFSSNNGTTSKSEIVLSITPHIIRPQTVPEGRINDVWSGTEAVVRDRPLRLDPIGTAAAGSLVGIDAVGNGTAAGGASAGAGATPGAGAATAPKAGGAGGSSILNANRPQIATAESAAAPGTAASAAAGSASGSDGTSASTGTASTGTTASPAGSTATTGSPGTATGVETRPSPRKPAPASIQPGRAMVPAAPSAPAGTAPTPGS